MATWLDFSGSPALLVSKASIHLWRGIFDPKSGEIFDLNPENPRTDYDRACKAAWSGTGIISIGDNTAVVLYSEEDTFAWFPDQQVIASGNWVPEPSELATAS